MPCQPLGGMLPREATQLITKRMARPNAMPPMTQAAIRVVERSPLVRIVVSSAPGRLKSGRPRNVRRPDFLSNLASCGCGV